MTCFIIKFIISNFMVVMLFQWNDHRGGKSFISYISSINFHEVCTLKSLKFNNFEFSYTLVLPSLLCNNLTSSDQHVFLTCAIFAINILANVHTRPGDGNKRGQTTPSLIKDQYNNKSLFSPRRVDNSSSPVATSLCFKTISGMRN